MSYKEPSIYPGISNDLCFIVDNDVPYQVIIDILKVELSKDTDVSFTIQPIDIYQSSELKNKDLKYITVRIRNTHSERTLEKQEIEVILKRASRGLRRKTNAILKE